MEIIHIYIYNKYGITGNTRIMLVYNRGYIRERRAYNIYKVSHLIYNTDWGQSNDGSITEGRTQVIYNK